MLLLLLLLLPLSLRRWPRRASASAEIPTTMANVATKRYSLNNSLKKVSFRSCHCPQCCTSYSQSKFSFRIHFHSSFPYLCCSACPLPSFPSPVRLQIKQKDPVNQTQSGRRRNTTSLVVFSTASNADIVTLVIQYFWYLPYYYHTAEARKVRVKYSFTLTWMCPSSKWP